MKKIHPVSDVAMEGKDEVDWMVKDIEDDMKLCVAQNDMFVKEFTGGKDQPSKWRAPVKNLNNAELKPKFLALEVRRSEEMEEEIKLSYELDFEKAHIADNTKLAENLRAQFTILTEQLKEYQKLNIAAQSKLKKAEAKVVELETKVDTLEEEADELKANGPTGSQEQTNLYTVRTNNRQPHMDEEVNKRTEQMRKALLSDDNDEGVAALSLNDFMASKNYYKSLKAWLLQSLPFKRDIRTVQARFGTSVASYFVFKRLVFLQISAIAAVMLVFAVYHLSTHFYNPSGTLSGYIQGEGYLPKFMIFSSFNTKEKFAYSAVVVLTMVFMTIVLCNDIVSEHKNAITLAAMEAENSAPYSKEVLCAWDFALHTKVDIEDLQGKHEHTFLQLIEDSHESGQKKDRTNMEAFIVYSRRTLGMTLYIGVVSGSFAAIIFLTIYGARVAEYVKDIPGVNNISTLISPLALQFINAVVPMLLQAITELEQWDSAQTELRFLLFRVYLSNTLNTLILTLSYIILTDPFLLANYPSLRRSLQLQENTVFTCRVDQAADGLFTLVGTTWAIMLVSFYATPVSMQLLSYLRGVPFVKSEFNIADQMVKMLSFLGLVFVAFPFAPLSMIFVPLYLFISFKFEKYIIKRYYAKPRRPFRGQQAALLYAVFYLITYVLVGISVSGYFITTKTMPKECGIQDDYVGLCTDEVGDAGVNLCTPDVSNQFYAFWGKSNDYPRKICEISCGPFVKERSALSGFKDSITGTGTLSEMWAAIFEFPYVPWFLVICLAMSVAVRVNSFEVSKFASYNKERAMESQLQASEVERKRQEKMIAKLKSMEEEDDEDVAAPLEKAASSK